MNCHRFIARLDASLWNFASVLFKVAFFLERHRPPAEPCRLVIVIPKEEWHWLCEKGLKDEIQQALSLHAQACLRRLDVLYPPFPVDLRSGEHCWHFFWEPIRPSNEQVVQLTPATAFFVVRDPRGAQMIPWHHLDNPRCPTPEEENADPSQLYDTLIQLHPRSPYERRWQSWEERIVCRRRVIFWRPGGENDDERVR